MSRKSNKKKRQDRTARPASSPKSTKAGTQRRQIRGGRLWCYRFLLAVLVPVLFLLGLEFALRQTGYGYSTEFFLPSERAGFYVENPRFAWQFYSPESRLKPHPFLLKETKEPGQLRVFVLGGSAALGTPESAYGFARILDRMLAMRFPDADVEIVNAAMPRINSHLVREIARDCRRFDPDLFVVYLGNNELVGLHSPDPDDPGLADHLPLLRLIQFVRSSRTGQLLAPVLGFLAPEQPEGEQDMAFFREHRLAGDNPGRQAVYANFRANLEDIIVAARDAGAKTLLSTLAVNYRECPPLGSLHDPALENDQLVTWESAYEKGISLQTSDDWAGALEQFEQARTIDDRFAELAFRRAQCLESLGDFAGAKAAYVQARDLDALPFRADSGINRVIRSLADAHSSKDVVLIDADEALGAEAGDDVALCGNETFYEHVHFKFPGDYRFATLLFDQIVSEFTDELGVSAGDAQSPPTLEECAQALAYNRVNEGMLESSIMDLLAHAPFLDQADHLPRMATLQEAMKVRYGGLTSEDVGTAFQVYQRAMEAYPDDWTLPYLLSRLHFTFHNFDAARENLKRALELMPHVLEVRLGYTRALIETRQFEEAFRQTEILQRMDPESEQVKAALSSAKARQAANR
jgi:tetratricopeptide (TPR) repeat protein